jgi:predicted membrane-bound dolichyl-phosphate-mannose-protein mannosyltransferase
MKSFYIKRFFLLSLDILESLEKREFQKVKELKEKRALYIRDENFFLTENTNILLKKQQENIIENLLRGTSIND